MYRERVDLIDSNLFSRKEKRRGTVGAYNLPRLAHPWGRAGSLGDVGNSSGKYIRVLAIAFASVMYENAFRQYSCWNLIRFVSWTIFIMAVTMHVGHKASKKGKLFRCFRYSNTNYESIKRYASYRQIYSRKRKSTKLTFWIATH